MPRSWAPTLHSPRYRGRNKDDRDKCESIVPPELQRRRVSGRRAVDVVVNGLLNAAEGSCKSAVKVGERPRRAASNGYVGERPLRREAYPQCDNVETACRVALDIRRNFKATIHAVPSLRHRRPPGSPRNASKMPCALLVLRSVSGQLSAHSPDAINCSTLLHCSWRVGRPAAINLALARSMVSRICRAK